MWLQTVEGKASFILQDIIKSVFCFPISIMPHLSMYWIYYKMFLNSVSCVTESHGYFSVTAGKEKFWQDMFQRSVEWSLTFYWPFKPSYVKMHSQNCEKLLLASSCPYIFLSTWNNLAPTGWIFMKFYVKYFSKICPEYSSFIKIEQE
jgi:hypothetical protein